MNRTLLLPYKMGSKSARTLARALEITRIYPNRRYRPRTGDIVINWGYHKETPTWWDRFVNRNADILNRPEAVAIASNKLLALQKMLEAGVRVPRFTANKADAADYETIYVRHNLYGNSGDGIEIQHNTDEYLSNAPLYVEGIDTKAEYRVHVFGDRVISYAKKRKRIDHPAPNEKIRSHNNGWVFTRENLTRLERVEELAINAVRSLGLDFGGVDIVRDQDNECFVLEVNTACGIEGQTLEAYVNAIKEYAIQHTQH